MRSNLRTELVIRYEGAPHVPALAGEALGRAGVNIHGYACEGDGDGGVVRFVTDDPEAGEDALAMAGLQVDTRLAVVTPAPNEPGEFGRAARFLVDRGLTIATSYLVLDPDSGLPQLAFTIQESDAELERVAEGAPPG